MDKFSAILQKSMTRKEFLVYVGMVFLSLIGINHTLQQLSPKKATPRKSAGINFGAGTYGGVERGS